MGNRLSKKKPHFLDRCTATAPYSNRTKNSTRRADLFARFQKPKRRVEGGNTILEMALPTTLPKQTSDTKKHSTKSLEPTPAVAATMLAEPDPDGEDRHDLSECHSANDIYVADKYFSGSEPVSEAAENAEFTVMKAAYPFTPQNTDELAFDKDDRIQIIEKVNDDATWLRGRNLTKNGVEGFAPYSYLVRDEDVPQSHEAWFDYTRYQAQRALLMPGVADGTFIIRPHGDEKDREKTTDVVVCVRFDAPDGITFVRQFRVSHFSDPTTNECKWRIGKVAFVGFSKLIAHLSKEPLSAKCCALVKAYPRTFAPPNRFRDFEVNREQVELQERLGKGSFGEVFRAVYCKCMPVAVKTLLEGRMSVQDFIKEAQAMYRLSHKNIVQLLGVCTKEAPIYIITELMEHGSLLQFLRKDAKTKPEPSLSAANLIDILAQVACGMDYLEQLNYVHRDLRAANILLSADNTAKVADFGLAKLCEEQVCQVDINTMFPLKWTAPEACRHRIYSSKSDVWSFGILSYEVVTRGGTPYPGMSATETLQFVCKAGRMKRPCGSLVYCPELLYNEVMLKCWSENAADRPNFRTLLEFLSGFVRVAEQTKRDALVRATMLTYGAQSSLSTIGSTF